MNPMDSWMQSFGQMLTMPMTMFSEAMSRAMRDFQPAAFLPAPCAPCESKPTVCEPVACAPVRAEVCAEPWGDRGWGKCCGTCGQLDGACSCNRSSCCNRCGRSGGDCCCNRGSDRVKLVQWSLVTVRRGAKDGVLDHGQCLVSDCTTPEEFRNMVIVDYAQKHRVDGKYLRVYTCVLDSWCKSDFDWEEEQIDALHEIRNAILLKNKAA